MIDNIYREQGRIRRFNHDIATEHWILLHLIEVINLVLYSHYSNLKSQEQEAEARLIVSYNF